VKKEEFKRELKKTNLDIDNYLKILPKDYSISVLSSELEQVIQNIYHNHSNVPKEEVFPFSNGISILLKDEIIDTGLAKLLIDYWDLNEFYKPEIKLNQKSKNYKRIISTGLKLQHILKVINFNLNLKKGILPHYGLN
jgi:hypothetical protein